MTEHWYLQVAQFLERGGPLMWILAGFSLVIWTGLLEHLLYLRESVPQLSRTAGELGQCAPGARSERLRRMVLSQARSRLERSLPIWRTLVTLCPLLGLIGTVLGMIEVFDSIAVLGTADPRALSNGISRAVLTTMAGLMIALPGLYLVNFVERRVQGVMHRLALASTPGGERR